MIERLFVDRAVCNFPRALKIMKRLRHIPPVVVSDRRSVQEAVGGGEDPVAAGKKTLFLTKNRGDFLKPCPGTREYICCGYHILNLATYCTMDCAYCILQAYFDPPFLQYFVNVDDLYEELDRHFSDPECPIHRVGTGEFTDSLIWDGWAEETADLVTRFAGQNRMILELKTKSVNIKALNNLDHRRKTIVSWSLNPPGVIAAQERNTAPLEARLQAAARCQSWGYPLAFHFDPMILFDGWERPYQQTVRRLFESVSPENIVWISLGSFRFMPPLKGIIAGRFPESKIPYGEFIRGLDGKMRYFKPLRINMYERMAQWIRERAPGVQIYFCMEDETVWRKALGVTPDRAGLARMLDEAAAKQCGIYL